MSNYTIQSGDTLSQIAQRNNRTVDELMAINPQVTDKNMIYAGQSLSIPSTATPISPASTGTSTGGVAPPTIDTSQFETGDPLRKFNLSLLDMLKKAQGGQVSTEQQQAQLREEAYESGQEVFTGADAKMTPDAKMAALNRNVQLYDPSIQAASLKIKQLSDITSLMKTTYGSDFSDMLPTTEEDAETFKQALRAGMTMPASIIEKYGKYFTTEDYALWAEAGKSASTTKQPTSVQEYEYYKQQEESAGRTPKSYGEFSEGGDDLAKMESGEISTIWNDIAKNGGTFREFLEKIEAEGIEKADAKIWLDSQSSELGLTMGTITEGLDSVYKGKAPNFEEMGKSRAKTIEAAKSQGIDREASKIKLVSQFKSDLSLGKSDELPKQYNDLVEDILFAVYGMTGAQFMPGGRGGFLGTSQDSMRSKLGL